MPANIILLNLIATRCRDAKLQLALFIHDVHIRNGCPSMQLHGLPMIHGGIPLSLIGGITLDNRSMNLIDHWLPECRPDKVLIAHLTGMHLDSHLSGKCLSQRIVQLYYRLRCNFSAHIYL